MQKVTGLAAVVLMAGVIYLGWKEYRNEKRYENNIKYTSLLIDSLMAKVDSLKARRKVISALANSIMQREKERKNEAAGFNSIDSLARLANELLAGKSN